MGGGIIHLCFISKPINQGQLLLIYKYMPQTEHPYRDITIRFPGQVIVGKNSLLKLTDEVTGRGYKSALIITIRPLSTKLEPLLAQFKEAGIAVHVDTSIVKEPSFGDFEDLLASVKHTEADVIIGIGGGSVLDVAKLIAAQIDNNQTLADITGIGLLKNRNKKLICVPTTAGTGSEASPNAILIDDADNQKKGIISPHLVPDVVIIDPALMISLPTEVTAATGLDALTHCLEAYTNLYAHPFMICMRLKGSGL